MNKLLRLPLTLLPSPMHALTRFVACLVVICLIVPDGSAFTSGFDTHAHALPLTLSVRIQSQALQEALIISRNLPLAARSQSTFLKRLLASGGLARDSVIVPFLTNEKARHLMILLMDFGAICLAWQNLSWTNTIDVFTIGFWKLDLASIYFAWRLFSILDARDDHSKDSWAGYFSDLLIHASGLWLMYPILMMFVSQFLYNRGQFPSSEAQISPVWIQIVIGARMLFTILKANESAPHTTKASA